MLKCHGCPRTFHRECLPQRHISRLAASGDGEPDILCELCAPLGWDAFAVLDEKQQAEAQEAQEEARHEAVAELMQEFDGLEDSLAGALLESCDDDKQLAAYALRLVELLGQAPAADGLRCQDFLSMQRKTILSKCKVFQTSDLAPG